jgi:TonB family protein
MNFRSVSVNFLLNLIKSLVVLLLLSDGYAPSLISQELPKQKEYHPLSADCDFSRFKPLRGSFDPHPGDQIVKPLYPEAARSSGIAGAVTVKVLVGLDGKVLKACAQKGPPPLLKASVEAALNCRFMPLLLNNKPRYVERTITFNYVLQKQSNDHQ